MGDRHLVRDTVPVTSNRVLRADGGLTASPAEHRDYSGSSQLGREKSGPQIGHKKTRGGPRVLSLSFGSLRRQAACLCIAPEAETVPRIAFTERSIAAQSRAISCAARPSA